MTRCENYLTIEKYIQERLPSKNRARHKGCSKIYDPYHRKRSPKARNKRASGTRLKLGNSVKMRPKDEDYIVRGSEPTKDYVTYHQQIKNKLTSRYRPRQIYFDTDSFRMGVDNPSKTCVCHNPDYFIGYITPINLKLKEINGSLKIIGTGTVRWRITDDTGKIHNINIENLLYVPDAPMCMISPQHWGQEANDHYAMEEGTRGITQSKNIILEWNQRNYQKTIPLCPSTNTGRFMSTPGSTKHRLFCAQVDDTTYSKDKKKVSYCMEINKEEEIELYDEQIDNPGERSEKKTTKIFATWDSEPEQRRSNEENIERDKVEMKAELNQMELLRWHHCLGHISFAKMNRLS